MKITPKSLVKNQNLIVFNAMNYLAEIVDSLLNLIDCILILDTFYLLEFWEEKKVVSLCMRFQRMQHIKYLFIKCVH